MVTTPRRNCQLINNKIVVDYIYTHRHAWANYLHKPPMAGATDLPFRSKNLTQKILRTDNNTNEFIGVSIAIRSILIVNGKSTL